MNTYTILLSAILIESDFVIFRKDRYSIVQWKIVP